MSFTVRMRRPPFFERSHAAGEKSYLLYNHVLIAGDFASAIALLDRSHFTPGTELTVLAPNGAGRAVVAPWFRGRG